jgi:hypothetical protein
MNPKHTNSVTFHKSNLVFFRFVLLIDSLFVL